MRRSSPSFILAALVVAAAAAGPGAAATGPVATGITHVEARRYEDARKLLEPYVARNARDAEATYYLGRSLFGLRRFDDAVAPLEKAAKLAPKRSEYHLWLARAYGRSAQQANVLRMPGLAKKSRVSYEEAVALDPGNLEARSDLIQFYLVAPGFMGGSVEKAREQAAEIKKRDAVRGAISFATIAMNQKDEAGAERELEAAIRAAPADPRPRLGLGSLYASQEKWDAAFAAFEALLTTDPDHWDALYQVGRTGAVSGRRLDRAEACLKRYLAHPPGPDSAPLANAHYRLGMVYEHKGDKAAARAEYQKALRLDPALDDAKEALGKLG